MRWHEDGFRRHPNTNHGGGRVRLPESIERVLVEAQLLKRQVPMRVVLSGPPIYQLRMFAGLET